MHVNNYEIGVGGCKYTNIYQTSVCISNWWVYVEESISGVFLLTSLSDGHSQVFLSFASHQMVTRL